MSLLFADIFEAIRYLRISKGTTEKEIMNYVQERVGGCMSVGNILKTIRTLNKLVEDGVLIKKGRRYVFPTKPPELQDNENENDEDDECEEGDDGQDDNQEDDSCDEEGGNDDDEEGGEEEEEEEEEDDDDDDEEDEDDDDDDDEDEGCEDQEKMPEPENNPPSCPEKSASKGLSQQKSPLNSGEPNGTENVGTNEEGCDKIPPKTSEIVTKKNGLKCGRKNGKVQNCGEPKNNGKNKGGEAIAFCARDFIDSQYSQNNTQAMPVTLPEKPQDDLIQIENCDNEPVARLFGMRKRESKSRKSRIGNDCRSRSPIRGHVKNTFFTDLKLDHCDDLRKNNMISSQIFQEMTDTPMDIDHDNEVVDLDFDILGHRSPIGPASPITPGVHLDRTESCCSQPNNKSPENIKLEPDFDCKTQFFLKKNADYKRSRHSMARAIDMQNKRLAEKDKEKHKRELCSEDGNGIKAEKRASLCSVCEKKKRNS